MASEVVLRINGKQIENSFYKLSSVVRNLERELKKLPEGTEEFLDKAAQLREANAHFQRVRNEINAVRNATEKTTGILGRFKNALGEVGTGFLKAFAVGNLIQGFSTKLSGTSEELLKLADQMSAVTKTSGLAKGEVKQLWDEFDKFNTRTTKMELLKISEMGGRLGISDLHELSEFTKEIDKAYVALGDSFSGGLEAVASQLGKIKGLFDDTAELSYAEAINKIGSALNELGASGTASEQNMAEFTLRIGRLPAALRPPVDQVIALGAAFEEMGVDARISSTGFSDFISTAAANVDKFAAAMNMNVEEARNLINTDPTQFFLRFAAGMKPLENNAVETANILKSLGLNSQAAQGAIGAAAASVDLFKDKLKISNAAFEEATSLQNEFNEVNNNAAAIWEKIKNVISEFFTSGEIFTYFDGIIRLIGDFAGVTEDASGRGERLRNLMSALATAVKLAIVAWVSYRIAVVASTLATAKNTTALGLNNAAVFLSNKYQIIAKGATLLWAAAKAVLTGNVNRATAAMRVFNTVTKMNPWGFIAGAIATVITYLTVFRDRTKEAGEAQKRLNAEQSLAAAKASEYANSVTVLKSKIDPLIAVLNNSNASLSTRRIAYERLIQIAPEFVGTVDAEYRATNRLTAAYDALIKKLDQAALARARQKVRQARADALAEAEAAEAEAEIKAAAEAKANEEIRKRNAAARKKAADDARKKLKEGRVSEFQQSTSLGLIDPESEKSEAAEALIAAKETTKLRMEEMNQWSDLTLKKVAELEKLKEEMLKAGASAEEIAKIDAEIRGWLNMSDDNQSVAANRDIGDPDKDKKKKKEKIDTGLKSAQQAEEEWIKNILKARRDFWDESAQLDEQGMETEIKLAQENTRRTIEDIELENEGILKRKADLQKEIDRLNKLKPRTAEEKKEIADAIAANQKAMAAMEEVYQINNDRLANIQEAGELKVKTIREKYIAQSLEDQQKYFEQEQRSEANQFEIGLAQLSVSEESKAKLRKEFQQKQLTEQAGFLDHLKSQINLLLQTGDFDALNLEDLVLSPEGYEELKKRLLDLGFSLEEVETALAKLNPNTQSEFEGVGMVSGADLFGFSADQWEKMFENIDQWQGKIEMIAAVTKAMQGIWNTFQDAAMKKDEMALKKYEANAQRKKDALQRQLDEGYINQKQYDAKIQQIEASIEKRRAELEYKQAKRQKQSAIIDSIVNTALAVTSALTAKPPLGMILASIVGALGAAQTAVIASQPLPSKGYALGGHTSGLGYKDETGQEVAGTVHIGEYVIPNWMKKMPVVANVIDWLEEKRTGGMKKFATGGHVDNDPTPVETDTDPLTPNNWQMFFGVILRFLNVVEKIEDEGLRAYVVGDERQGKALKKSIQDYELLKNKNKR